MTPGDISTLAFPSANLSSPACIHPLSSTLDALGSFDGLEARRLLVWATLEKQHLEERSP